MPGSETDLAVSRITRSTRRPGTSSSPRRAGPTTTAGSCSIGWDGSTSSEFLERRTSADLAFINNGITFSVYSDRRGIEKIFPFDLIPRPVSGEEWDRLEAGLVQRIRALNLFLDDVYHDQRILKEGVIPANLVLESKGFRPEMIGFSPPGKQYMHVVRHRPDPRRRAASSWCSRTTAARPSGVSYVLENRVVMKKVFPQLFQQCRVRRVEDYPRHLLGGPQLGRARRAPTTRRASCCCRRGRTTRPTSSTASWPGTWASSWSSARTCSCTTSRSILQDDARARSGST